METGTTKWKYVLLVVLLMIVIIAVGTYAWLTYRTNDTAMVLTIGEINNVQVTLSPYQIDTSLFPQVTYVSDKYTSVNAVNNSTAARNIRLFYKINSIDSELISSNFKYTIERSTNGTTYSVYKNGNFSSVSNGGELTILEESIPGNNTTYNYKVYLWIDGSSSGQSSMQGKSFNGELSAEIAGNQYQFVEYLESTGTQYIDTGYSGNDLYQIDTKMEVISVTSNYWFGQQQAHGAMMFNGLYSNRSLEYNWATISRTLSNMVIMTQELDGAYVNITINDVLYRVPAGVNDSTGNFYIFACNGGSRTYGSIRVYYFKLHIGDQVIRDFIPAYRKSDGVRGLYDTVNDVFYTNAGSGTFEIGPEV